MTEIYGGYQGNTTDHGKGTWRPGPVLVIVFPSVSTMGFLPKLLSLLLHALHKAWEEGADSLPSFLPQLTMSPSKIPKRS